MKLREYYNDLKILIEKYPELLDMDVIYSQDAGHNTYGEVFYNPCYGCYEHGEFIECLSEPEDTTNAVCLN